MKTRTWLHALLHLGCVALLLLQGHRIKQFQDANREARQAEVFFTAEDLATTEAIQRKLIELQQRLGTCEQDQCIHTDRKPKPIVYQRPPGYDKLVECSDGMLIWLPIGHTDADEQSARVVCKDKDVFSSLPKGALYIPRESDGKAFSTWNLRSFESRFDR